MDRQLVQLLSNCFCSFCGSMPILYSGMFLYPFIISFLQCQPKALVKRRSVALTIPCLSLEAVGKALAYRYGNSSPRYSVRTTMPSLYAIL